MKTIKLASVFAVTAVAAAVSSTTFAANAGDVLTVSGKAGVEYTDYTGNLSDSKGDIADGTDLGKVKLIADTGVVHAKVEIDGTNRGSSADIKIKELYVKQGAASFGRFDGTLADAAQMGVAEFDVAEISDKRVTLSSTDNTGIRYKATPEFTIAIEATGARDYQEFAAPVPATKDTPAVASKPAQIKTDSKVGLAASYIKDFGFVKVGASAGSVGGASAYNLGVQTTFGITTFAINYGGGKKVTGALPNGDMKTQDQKIADVSLNFAFTDAFSVAYEYARDIAATNFDIKNRAIDGTYLKAEYNVGDLSYYFKTYGGDNGSEGTILDGDGTRNIFGVTASF